MIDKPLMEKIRRKMVKGHDDLKKQLLNDFKTPLSKNSSKIFIETRIEELKQKLNSEDGE